MEKPEEYRIDHRERYYILDVHNFFLSSRFAYNFQIRVKSFQNTLAKM